MREISWSVSAKTLAAQEINKIKVTELIPGIQESDKNSQKKASFNKDHDDIFFKTLN